MMKAAKNIGSKHITLIYNPSLIHSLLPVIII